MVATDRPTAPGDEDGRATDSVPEGMVPRDVGSPHAKVVYLVLQQEGPLAPEQLQERLESEGLAMFSIEPILRSLRRRGYVERTDRGYVVTA